MKKLLFLGYFIFSCFAYSIVDLSTIAANNSNLIINDGQTYRLTSALNDIQIFRLNVVNGSIICPSDNQDIRLNVRGIYIGTNGSFQCGNSSSRFEGILDIVFSGNAKYGHPKLHGKDNGKNFIVEGNLKLFGKVGKHRVNYLTRDIPRNGLDRNKVLVTNDSLNWEVNDEIVVTSSGLRAFGQGSELKRITSVPLSSGSGVEIELDSNISYFHTGRNVYYPKGNGTNWQLKSRSEVLNLTRNIKIRSDVNDPTQDIGAHLMIKMGGFARIDSVEFIGMGQQGTMGRYPIHWHMVHNGAGQFIKNSSIHGTKQRCIVLHDTNGLLIHNNVCYDHFGHGIFLESGTEINNTIKYNKVIKSKRITNQNNLLLASEGLFRNSNGVVMFGSRQRDRWSPPAAYWISNPQNIVENNISNESEGTGFWNSFTGRELIIDGESQSPNKMQVSSFKNNIAKNNVIGITWDGAEESSCTPTMGSFCNLASSTYERELFGNQNAEESVFSGNQVMWSKEAGVYTRSHTMTLNNWITSENVLHHFHAHNTKVKNSLVVGLRSNHLTLLNKGEYLKLGGTTQYGVRIYDGPFELKNVHFEGYIENPVPFSGSKQLNPIPFGGTGGTQKLVNTTEDLFFGNSLDGGTTLERRISLPSNDVYNTIHDLDGSLFGNNSSVIILANNNLNFRSNRCSVNNANNVVLCDDPLEMVSISTYTPNFENKLIRVVPDIKLTSDSSYFINDTGEANIMVRKYLNYQLRHSTDLGNGTIKSSLNELEFRVHGRQGRASPLIKMTKTNPNLTCELQTIPLDSTKVENLGSNYNAVRANPKSGFSDTGTSFFFRLRPFEEYKRTLNSDSLLPSDVKTETGRFKIVCN